MMTHTAFVTGATGFLGLNLVRRLRAHGVRVRALVRPQSDVVARAELVSLGAELVPGGIHDAAALHLALAGVDTVFHLAGRLFTPGIAESEYEDIHIGGTHTLLRACAEQHRLRAIVHCSTTGVLGPTGTTPADEHGPQNPSNAYERTKLAGEQLAVGLAQIHGLPLVVARPALVYGPGDLHLLGWFRAIKRGYYRVVGRGDNLLHPIYIDDLIEGLLACAAHPAAVGQAYNLVGERALSIRELASAIGVAVGRRLPRAHLPLSLAYAAATTLEALPGVPPASLPLTRSRIAFMTESRAYCGERARRELGFVPQIGLQHGLRRTVAWYRERGLLT